MSSACGHLARDILKDMGIVVGIEEHGFVGLHGHQVNDTDFKWEVLKAKKNPCCWPGQPTSLVSRNSYDCAQPTNRRNARLTNENFSVHSIDPRHPTSTSSLKQKKRKKERADKIFEQVEIEMEHLSSAMFDLHATFSNRNVTLLAKFDTTRLSTVR